MKRRALMRGIYDLQCERGRLELALGHVPVAVGLGVEESGMGPVLDVAVTGAVDAEVDVEGSRFGAFAHRAFRGDRHRFGEHDREGHFHHIGVTEIFRGHPPVHRRKRLRQTQHRPGPRQAGIRQARDHQGKRYAPRFGTRLK